MSVLQSLLELGKETGTDLLTFRPGRDRLSACLAWPELLFLVGGSYSLSSTNQLRIGAIEQPRTRELRQDRLFRLNRVVGSDMMTA